MSRGLGKIQSMILNILKTQKNNTDSIFGLCNGVYKIHDMYGDLIPPRKNHNPTPAEYQSVCRALRQLQKRGIVDIIKIPCRNGSAYRDRDRHDQRGGQSYYKEAKCLVQGNSAMNSTLTVTDKGLVQSQLSMNSTLIEGV